jgi:hypothetical protein
VTLKRTGNAPLGDNASQFVSMSQTLTHAVVRLFTNRYRQFEFISLRQPVIGERAISRPLRQTPPPAMELFGIQSARRTGEKEGLVKPALSD